MSLRPLLSRRAVLAGLGASLAAPRISLAASPKGLPATIDAFGDRVCASLVAAAPGRNVMLAPYNLHSALLLLTAAGDAKAQRLAMRSTLLNGMSTARANRAAKRLAEAVGKAGSEKILIKSAASVWVPAGRSVRREYEKAATESFDATVKAVDFAAPATVAEINGWVASATDQKITDIVEQLDARVEFLLATAMFFKGQWSRAFDPAATAPAAFTLRDGSAKQVAMMSSSRRAAVYADDDIRAVTLPFGEEKGPVQFIILQSARDADLRPLANLQVARWIGRAKFAPTLVELQVPKLRASFKADLEPALKAAGLGFIFDGKSDFSGVTGVGAKEIDVAHAVDFELDEQGAQAAAASVVTSSRSAEPVIRFTADRPFAFAIYDESAKVALVQGRIEDPSA